MLKTLATFTALLSLVHSHGYLTVPLARQENCYLQGGFYWPEDGSGIPDIPCRNAYRHVFEKSGAAAAQSMFVQRNEYAAFAGKNISIEWIKESVVPEMLCSAHANGTDQFGDKSGMDLVQEWGVNILTSGDITLEFCATAVHDPSNFYVFQTDESWVYGVDAVSWDHLVEIARFVHLPDSPAVSPRCEAPTSYKMPVKLSSRGYGVIYVVWIRDDPVGEGFYNCVDYLY